MAIQGLVLFERTRGGLLRYRLGAMFVVGGLIFATLGIHSAAASGATLTRLRIELSGTAEWMSVSLSDSLVAVHYVASQTAGTTIERGSNSVVLHRGAASSVSAITDVLVEITNPNSSTFAVSLAKSKAGVANLKLSRTNGTSTQILALSNSQTSGECRVTAYVARSNYVSTGYAMPRVDPRRLVLAFYYPWFQEGSFDSGPWYDEPSSSYDTQAPAEIAKQLDQAKAYGVDGMVISWDDVGDHTQRFDTTMAAARARSMYVSPVIELLMWKTSTGFNVTGIINTMKLALDRSADPAFLKVGTRPVLFVFGAFQMGADVWKSVAAGLAAGGYDPFYIGEPADPTYGFHGSYAYNPNGTSYNDLLTKNVGYMRTVRYPAQVTPGVPQRLWAATVSPGQNLSYANPLFPKHEDREDGARYDLTWNAALWTNPEWVLITSWNEWFEATHISPSKKFGWQALQQTGGWAAGFHNPSAWGGESDSGGLLDKLPPIPLKLGAAG